MTKQIETYERPYQIVYGEDGQDATVINGPQGKEFPIWRARQFVVALLTKEIEKAEGDQRTTLANLRLAFKDAAVGDLAFGMVRKWKNTKGSTRFIGIVEKGQDYRTAGSRPKPAEADRVAWTPPRAFDKPIVGQPWRERQHTPRAPKPKPMSEAERIADRMAKASRAAAEDNKEDS